MPRPKKPSTAPKTVMVTEPTLKALIRCRNELYEIYSQFGGTSNIHISKGLGDEKADWNFINNWEIDNIDNDDEPVPTKKNNKIKSKPLETITIAENIASNNKQVACALKFLNSQEVKTRLYNLFDDDVANESLDLVSTLCDCDTHKDLVNLLKYRFGIGFDSDTKWLASVSVKDFLNILYTVQDIWGVEALTSP